MKRFVVILTFALSLFGVQAQQVYWVFLADKQGSSFDPYAYFDAKAIERYRQCGANLYDISNYPLNQGYVDGVNALATEEIGCSRWMNAMGVMATPEQARAIEALPYVRRVQLVVGDGMQLAHRMDIDDSTFDYELTYSTVKGPLSAQLVSMGGKDFRDKGYDGKGVRIAVFDGGFPRVNTHAAFKHLRDNNLIVKTWNFVNKKENVYGWNSHGTMTLSCIAGRDDTVDLGLATGSEFLLARTEVASEPFKEEVWWQMAMEWADKNGANIISSSLGYGKERHYTRDMDGTSYVAKAANMAARKGILVCNSAGNEADDRQWRTIITPSDADSVLCVGGINNSLTKRGHINFSSYGPSADGRQKPNVCAFGYAWTANVTDDEAFHYVPGTSFSCPLVAGFAACAWQASPGKTAMEMFHAIEQSADLYPYCDYTYGYGVPQAKFFTSPDKKPDVAPTFRFEVKDGELLVRPLQTIVNKLVLYKEQASNGYIYRYAEQHINYLDTTGALHFSMTEGNSIVVHLDGYTGQYESTTTTLNIRDWKDKDIYTEQDEFTTRSSIYDAFGDITSDNEYVAERQRSRTAEENLTPSKWGSCNTWRYNLHCGWGTPVVLDGAEKASDSWSPCWTLGFRILRSLSKSYCIGMSFEFRSTHYRFNDSPANEIESAINSAGLDITTLFRGFDTRRLLLNEHVLELFQRVRLVPIGLMGNGLHWDLGVYGSIASRITYDVSGDLATRTVAERVGISIRDIQSLSDYHLNYGLVTRLAYDWIGIYLHYRLNNIGQDVPAGKILFPRLTTGLYLTF